MPYFNFILVDNKTSHSVEITSWKRYVDNIHTLSENMKFIYTSFRNVTKREHYMSLSDLFHSDWKWIIYFPKIYTYCIYHVMSNAPKQQSHCLNTEKTSVVLIVFGYVLCEVRVCKLTSRNVVDVSYRRSTWIRYNKTISWSVIKYNKQLSGQCNMTAQIEQLQDNKH